MEIDLSEGRSRARVPERLGQGGIYANPIERGFAAIQHRADVIVLAPVLDDDGKPIINNAG